MQLIINGSDLEFLLNNFQQEDFVDIFDNAKEKGEYLAKGRYPTGKYTAELSSEGADRVKTALSVLLTEKGLGSDGEPNEIGMRIERLIDQLSIEN